MRGGVDLSTAVSYSPEMDSDLKARLLEWRERHRMTNRMAAAVLGISRRTFESWACGQRAPRGLALVALERAISGPRMKPRAVRPTP